MNLQSALSSTNEDHLIVGRTAVREPLPGHRDKHSEVEFCFAAELLGVLAACGAAVLPGQLRGRHLRHRHDR